MQNPVSATPGRPEGEVRTSASHPLRIDALAAGGAGGQIGITLCPGKQAPSATGPSWQRDLDTDLDLIKSWNTAALLSLIEDHEFSLLGVAELGQRARARGMQWFHLPIRDGHAPDARFDAAWAGSGPELLQHLRGGRRVVVHCRGGLGRAGTVSARLLVELGVQPDVAMRKVRLARPGAIETLAQERYVLGLGHDQVD
jgi:ADP-ribosyl-[dinitrogen reductase] hydrolase